MCLNTLQLDQFPWQGTYFADIANILRPIPSPGYRFVEWLGPEGSSSAHSLSFSAQRDSTNTLIARMDSAAASSGAPSELIITEIQYQPAAGMDSGDWLELYHRGAAPLDLSGWIFRDEDDQHAFLLPELILEPGASLILCQDDSRFRLFHPSTVRSTGGFRFSLGNGGDTLRLFRPDGSVALALTYRPVAPWPEGAGAGGFTLQLMDPLSDPTLPGSWRASAVPGGTPGQL